MIRLLSWNEKVIEKYQKKIAVGGEWFLKPRKKNQKRLVLVAGGVGINPILSMVRQLASNDDGWERDRIGFRGLFCPKISEFSSNVDHGS